MDSTQEDDWPGVSQLTEGDREKIKEAQELPLHLLKELNSVLTVRNEVKEKKRQEKRRTRNTKLHPQVDINTTISASEDCKPANPVTPEQFRVCLEENTESAITSVDDTKRKLSSVEETIQGGHVPKGDIHQSSEQGHEAKQTTNEEDKHKQFVNMFGDLDQRGLAQAVAAAALRTKRQHSTATEVFYEDSDD